MINIDVKTRSSVQIKKSHDVISTSKAFKIYQITAEQRLVL